MDNTIKINDTYSIRTIPMNYVLVKRIITREGNERFDEYYYGDLKSLLAGMVNKSVQDDLGVIKNIEMVTDFIDEMRENIDKAVSEMK